MGNERGGAGIIDEDVESAEFGEGGFHEFATKAIVADVSLNREGPNSASLDSFHRLQGLLFGGAVVDDDMASGICQF